MFSVCFMDLNINVLESFSPIENKRGDFFECLFTVRCKFKNFSLGTFPNKELDRFRIANASSDVKIGLLMESFLA
jgi:hypothetical protein